MRSEDAVAAAATAATAALSKTLLSAKEPVYSSLSQSSVAGNPSPQTSKITTPIN